MGNFSCVCLYYRKGSVLVMPASVIFLVLMIPRGIYFAEHILTYNKGQQEPREQSAIYYRIWLDMTSWWLQYINHSVNLFVYMIFIRKFRPCARDTNNENQNMEELGLSRQTNYKSNTCTNSVYDDHRH